MRNEKGFVVGDKVKMNTHGGSVGVVVETFPEGVLSGMHSPYVNVQWIYGRAKDGTPVTGDSRHIKWSQLIHLTDEQFKACTEREFNEGKTNDDILKELESSTTSKRIDTSQPNIANASKPAPEEKPAKTFSVHELVGFDKDLELVWSGGLGMVANLLAGIGAAANIKTAKNGPNNPRLSKSMTPNVLRVLRASFALLLEDFNERAEPAPGKESEVARQRESLKKVIAKIDAKLLEASR